jgi:hypothetical protein
VAVELWADNILADERLVSLAVDPAGAVRLPQLVLRGALEVEPGKNARLRVGLDRRGYRGPVDLALRDLPEGVTYVPTSIDAEQEEGEVEVQAGADVMPGEYAAHLLARVKDETVHDLPLTVRVPKPATVVTPPVGPKPRPDLAAPQAVQFATADQVTLRGLLYPGGKRKKGACVLLVHDLGRGHRGSDLASLAQALQAAGHTVLQFDLRGHGDSTAVTQNFWTFPVNSANLPAGKAGGRMPEAIDARRFPLSYYPYLAHDLAAARAFLDERHNEPDGPVHAGQLVVVGAGEGAALGALWLAAEYRRFGTRRGVGGLPEMEGSPETTSVIGALWLTMPATLGRGSGQEKSLQDWVKDAGRYGEVPMCFLHGADDVNAAGRAQNLVSQIKDNPAHLPLTAVKAVPKTGAGGTDLLKPALDTEAMVVAFVDSALKARETKWAPREFATGTSYYVFPGARMFARGPGQGGLQIIPLDRLGVRLNGLRTGKF